jgi:hypothetical protein
MKAMTVAAAVLAAALGLAACGSADNGSETGAKTSSNASSAAQDTSAKVGGTVDFADVMTKSAQAVKDKKTGHLSMDMAGLGAVEADVDYGSSSPAMSMTMELSGQKMQLLFVDKTFYMGGDVFSAMTGGKKWIKADPNGSDPLSKQLAPMFEQMDSMAANPAEQFAAMKGVKATVVRSDPSSTTYDVSLSKDEISKLQQLPGLGADAAKSLPDGIEYSITLDKDQLPTLVETQVQGQSVKVTMSKWGEAVSVKAPPASEVGTFSMPSS